MNRIDTIHVYEVVDVLKDAPMDHIDWMGFGKDKDTFLTEPTILGLGLPFFAQSMHMIADGLGVTIDEVTAAEVDIATAAEDIPHDEGAIAKGTVAAQRHEWTMWVGGQPLIVFHAIYVTAGPEKLEPAWDWGETRYEIVIDGDPPTELDPQRCQAEGRHHGPSRLRLDGHGRHQRDPGRLRCPAGLAQPPRPRARPAPRPGPEMSTESSLHHVVFAVAADRQAGMVQLFTDLGFTFNAAELTDLGVHVQLDWDRGVELISPVPWLDRVGGGVGERLPRPPRRRCVHRGAPSARRRGGRDRGRALRVGDAVQAGILRRGVLSRRDRLCPSWVCR